MEIDLGEVHPDLGDVVKRGAIDRAGNRESKFEVKGQHPVAADRTWARSAIEIGDRRIVRISTGARAWLPGRSVGDRLRVVVDGFARNAEQIAGESAVGGVLASEESLVDGYLNVARAVRKDRAPAKLRRDHRLSDRQEISRLSVSLRVPCLRAKHREGVLECGG